MFSRTSFSHETSFKTFSLSSSFLDKSDKTSFVISTFVSPFPSHLCHTRRQNFLTSIEPWTIKMLPLLCCSISMHSSIYLIYPYFLHWCDVEKQHGFHWLIPAIPFNGRFLTLISNKSKTDWMIKAMWTKTKFWFLNLCFLI